MKRNDKAHMAANSARDHARQVAAQVKPFARRGVHRIRAWAAPQVERTGQVLQDSVTPKVSALLSSTAQRLDPAKPRRRPWRKLVGISVVTAAAGAAAAVVRNRRKPDVTTSAAEADADDLAPAAEMRDGPGRTSADADVNGRVRTS